MATEADLQKADAELKAADAAYTEARARVFPRNNPTAKLNSIISDGGDKPGSELYPTYLIWKAKVDEAVATEAATKAAYLAAQQNYKTIYDSLDNTAPASPPATATTPVEKAPVPAQTPDASSQNPGGEEAVQQATGPQAVNLDQQPNVPTNTDPAVTQAQDNAAVNTPETPPATAPEPVTGPTGTPYDDEGNLNVGWGKDEDGNPVWVGAGYIDATGEGAPVSAPPKVDGPTGTPYDDEGNLNPGWSLDENNNPVWVGGNFVEPATQASAEQSRTEALGQAKANAQKTATNQDAVSFQKAKDWRVRLSLAPSAKYLYNATNPGILKPLAATNGVIFPYTPAVSVAYNAAYEGSDLIHSNYKIYNYKNSSVDNVTITGEFTAQDTNEASYLLAVIHFFRSVTKMFYGRDENPRNGVPPPLCYLSGLGAYQFDNHPLAITNFTYTLPTEVDYIRAGSMTNEPGANTGQQTKPTNTDSASQSRIQTSGLGPKTPNFQRQSATINSSATYVPTRMSITITCIPIVTRNDISNKFSLKDYATGSLLQGSKRNGGGIW